MRALGSIRWDLMIRDEEVVVGGWVGGRGVLVCGGGNGARGKERKDVAVRRSGTHVIEREAEREAGREGVGGCYLAAINYFDS